ncbi:RagB/SusD family nutrient uptake outer membrane protein [Chitinophaga sp. SYP-B3965]|uniref:RagB/SusD family nutrient uptake outer membrane protein n=1 Tax=Chitinophaga sp. SYP-B3965 TaxID=2663120 RepID=UPI00129967C9|nr:RagB/SusD family nutrient uptake outer membrane protein [Chitinophaga sp. SYP-B3965]MRG47533.1 RagB/SusD family nutrient uptake outer membrane protein [Chitinophaga sp. SYP-B3965]
MKRLKYMAAVILLAVFPACNTLDIPPVSVIQDPDIFTDDAGIAAYMASLYSRMPMEDFKFSTVEGTAGFNTWNIINSLSINTGENANRNNGGFSSPARGYWGDAYGVIRYANNLIENLPKYSGNFTKDKIARWVGEAKFIRAYTYFALVKRYGGVPLVKVVQEFNGSNAEELKVPRSSEQESYDFIAADLDSAYAGLGETSESKGRVNKYIAAAFKSRAMLFAGSIARYGTPYTANGIVVCGMPASKANDYFKASYDAAKLLENKYSLYKKKWSATDKLATADNYADLFLDATSTETIFIKGYSFPESVHSWDAVNAPAHLTSTYGDRFCPTLDYVELFDGLPKNAKGQLNTLDINGAYKVYNNVRELFDTCEPRLRGTVLLPGQKFKDGYTDLRRGTFVESIDPATPILKFFPDDSKTAYSQIAFYKTNVKESSDWKPAGQVTIVLSTGEKIYASGQDGPTSNKGSASVTGFAGRKYMDPVLPSANTTLHRSIQPWIEIRYAEILLNRAEAALELQQNGGTIAGVDLQQDAFTCINLIRERAGATMLTDRTELSASASIPKEMGTGGYVLAPNRGLQIIRIERRKELAFENKLYWDMCRWRTFDQEVNARTWRMCNPFLFAKGAKPELADYVNGKYIFDCRFDERNSSFTFPVRNYYEPIPGGEITKANLSQNPGY